MFNRLINYDMINFMKRIIFALLFLFTFSGIFAISDFSNSTLSVGIAFPYMKHDYKIENEDSITLFGTGVDLNYRHQNEGFSYGLFINASLYFPAYKTVNLSDSKTTSKNVSDYDYFFGIDTLAGVYKVLHRSEGVVIPAGIGIHLDGYANKLSENGYSVTERVYTMGIGGWANYEVNVSEKFGVFAGIKVIYDFYHQMKNSGAASCSDSGTCNAWAVIPAVGAAFHF